jgi:hypothetical protein
VIERHAPLADPTRRVAVSAAAYGHRLSPQYRVMVTLMTSKVRAGDNTPAASTAQCRVTQHQMAIIVAGKGTDRLALMGDQRHRQRQDASLYRHKNR